MNNLQKNYILRDSFKKIWKKGPGTVHWKVRGVEDGQILTTRDGLLEG